MPLAVALTIAGAALVWWVATSDAQFPGKALLFGIGAAAAVGIPVQSLNRARWVELADAELRLHRGDMLRRTWPTSDVIQVKPLLGLYFAVFSDGSRVWVDHTTSDGARILDILRDQARTRTFTAADIGTGTIDGIHTLRIANLRFPPHCVRCHTAPTSTWSVIARSGIDLIVFSYHTVVATAVPVCARCKRRRRLVGFATHVLPFFVVIAIGAALRLAYGSAPADPGMIAGAIGVSFLLAILFIRNWASRVADQRVLGISGIGLTKDHGSVRLRFRDQALAQQVVQLTRDGVSEVAV